MLVFDPIPARWNADRDALPRRLLSWLELPGGSGTLAGTSQGIYRRRSESKSWQPIGGTVSKREIYDLFVDPESGTVLAGTDTGIYIAPRNSFHFAPPDAPLFASKVISFAAIEGKQTVLLAATSSGILVSLDQGKTWHAGSIRGIPARAVLHCLQTHPEEHGRLFACTSAGLFESRDGSNWIASGGGLLSSGVSTILFLPNKRVVVGDGVKGGVFFSGDDGVNWQKIEAAGFSAPVQTMAADTIDSNFVYLGTTSDGIYRLRVP